MKKHFILSLVFIFSFACSISRAETQQYEILHTPEQEEAHQRELEEKRLRVERGPFSLYPFGDFDKENQNFYGFAPLWTYSPRDFYGLGVGIYSEVERDVVGVLLSVKDTVHGDFTGIQMAGLLSETKGDLTGIQAGCLSITRGDFNGIQMAGLLSFTEGDFTGIQAGYFSITEDDFTGVQLGLLNSSSDSAHDEFLGIQLGGIVSGVCGDFLGLQISCVYNLVEEDFTGLQFCGVNDVYGDFTGLQVGLFNFVEGNLHGIQIGLWNECKQGNMPLINIRF